MCISYFLTSHFISISFFVYRITNLLYLSCHSLFPFSLIWVYTDLNFLLLRTAGCCNISGPSDLYQRLKSFNCVKLIFNLNRPIWYQRLGFHTTRNCVLFYSTKSWSGYTPNIFLIIILDVIAMASQQNLWLCQRIIRILLQTCGLDHILMMC